MLWKGAFQSQSQIWWSEILSDSDSDFTGSLQDPARDSPVPQRPHYGFVGGDFSITLRTTLHRASLLLQALITVLEAQNLSHCPLTSTAHRRIWDEIDWTYIRWQVKSLRHRPNFPYWIRIEDWRTCLSTHGWTMLNHSQPEKTPGLQLMSWLHHVGGK